MLQGKYSWVWVLAIGTTDLILGFTGILLALLDPDSRHSILNPVESLQEVPYVIHDAHKDTFQFFIEFWMPSLSLVLVGALIILSSLTKKPMIAIVTFVMSTIQVAGFVAGLFALLLSGANRVGMIPFVLVTVTQVYFHWVVALFTRFAWGPDFRDDTQDLIESKSTLNASTKDLPVV